MGNGPGPPGRGRWNDLRLRIGSAVVLIPLALASIWTGGLAFAGLVALAIAGCGYEWLGLFHRTRDWRHAAPFAGPPLAALLIGHGAALGALGVLAAAFGAGVAAAAAGRSSGRWVPFGILYAGVPAIALVWMRGASPAGMLNVAGILLIIWATDIGAYVTGRAVGGRRLAPAISPGKTWSGAIGGLAAAGLAGAALSAGSSLRAVLFALLLSIVGQAGDLFESWLKRRVNVKDSGLLIPGHGGLLDRLDALLAAVPVGALLALVLGRGVSLWE